MSVKQIIEELKKMNKAVEYRKRTDGGYIITKIGNMTFEGSKGNAFAREILGITLSEAKMKQLEHNVGKFIKGKKKKPTLDKEMKDLLRKVQREWRKRKVKGEITAIKLKQHIKDMGRKEAKRYLQRMSRYGQGYAYEENVFSLAQYVYDTALGADNEELQRALFDLDFAIGDRVETFKESWINPIYREMYKIINDFHYDPAPSMECVNACYRIMES